MGLQRYRKAVNIQNFFHFFLQSLKKQFSAANRARPPDVQLGYADATALSVRIDHFVAWVAQSAVVVGAAY